MLNENQDIKLYINFDPRFRIYIENRLKDDTSGVCVCVCVCVCVVCTWMYMYMQVCVMCLETREHCQLSPSTTVLLTYL